MDLKIDELRVAAKHYFSKCPRTKERLLALIELSKRSRSNWKLRELDYERVAAEFGRTSRTLHRWKKSWDEWGVKGLVPKASPGRKKRPISGFTARKILEYRTNYNWGAEVIQAHLKFDFGQTISQDRIHRFLLRQGFVKKIRTRKPKKKHTKIVKVDKPGAHTQNDVKHLPHMLPNSVKSYVYNFVDHACKWEMKRAYDSYGPAETKDFAQRVVNQAPFKITRWQTDNGVEFTFKFLSHVDKPKKHALDRFCESNDIKHVLIPPGEKELQGLVERSHRMDDDELYHRIEPQTLDELNRYLDAHCAWKNARRRRKSLDWKTPNQWLEEYGKQILSGLVRPEDPLDSVRLEPNEGLKHKNSWQDRLLEVRGRMARETVIETAKLGGPSQTRQNYRDITKQTEGLAQSVVKSKKAA
jgi:transposase